MFKQIVSLFGDATLAIMTAALVAAVGCGGGSSQRPETEHYLAALKSLEAGDTAKAKEEFLASIEAKPRPSAYLSLAKISLDEGDEAAARRYVDEGLAVDSDFVDLKWYKSELAKPAGQRFKGRFATPPSSSK